VFATIFNEPFYELSEWSWDELRLDRSGRFVRGHKLRKDINIKRQALGLALVD